MQVFNNIVIKYFGVSAERSCTNLTRNDAPEDGGLICHWYREENAQHCDVKCNPGYEMALRVNNYETCGPTTNYIWSYKLQDAASLISPCVRKYC